MYIVGILAFIIIIASWIIANKQVKDEIETIDKFYNVGKFPVISLLGNKYYAEIVCYRGSLSKEDFDCKIYSREFKSNGKFKDAILVNEPVALESFDYDYIHVVSMTITKYENRHMQEILKKKHEDEIVPLNKQLFREWNGNIKESCEKEV